MTAQQRRLLALMEPGCAYTTGVLAAAYLDATGGKRTTVGRSVLRMLYLLREHGHVRRDSAGDWSLQPAAEPTRRRARARKTPTTRKRDVTPARLKPPPRRRSVSERALVEKTKPIELQRYGVLFLRVRVLRCWLDLVGYSGPGHERCGPGVQGGHTAHHTGYYDVDGLLPGCGAAHDLYARLGGEKTVESFDAWMAENGHDLDAVARLYVERAAERTQYDDHAATTLRLPGRLRVDRAIQPAMGATRPRGTAAAHEGRSTNDSRRGAP